MTGNSEQNQATSGPFNVATREGYDFSSREWQNVHNASLAVMNVVLNSLQDGEKPYESFFNLPIDEVRHLYAAAKEMSKGETRLMTVRDNLRGHSLEQLAAIMQIEAVRGRLWTGAHIVAERNQQNQYHGGSQTFDRAARRESFVETVRMFKELGYRPEDVREIFSNIKIWETFTPHPTKDKNELGEKLFRAQASHADTEKPENREQAIAHDIHDMLVHDITPRKKDTLEDETRDGLGAQSIYNTAIVHYFEDMQMAFDTIYEGDKIDLLDESMKMDVSSRKWHGGDADGKKVAATVLFNQRVQDALEALSFYNRYLEAAQLPKGPGHERLAAPIEAFREIEKKLESLKARGAEIVKAGSVSDTFEAAKQEFVDAFIGIDYKGERFDSGPKLTERVLRDIRELAYDNSVAPEIRANAWRTAFLHKQNGMAMGRTELRHNNDDYKVILERFYKYVKVNQTVIAEPETDFSAFSEKSKRVLLHRLQQSHGDKIGEWLLAANPFYRNEDAKGLQQALAADDHLGISIETQKLRDLGWSPEAIELCKQNEESKGQLSQADLDDLNWPREILERLRLKRKCYNHNRLTTAIIAEADGAAANSQQFIAEAFDNQNMLHIPLNENIKTMRNAGKNFGEYTKVEGKRNLGARSSIANGNGHTNGYTNGDAHAEQAFKDMLDAFYCVMDPQSDSQKANGVLVRMLQLKTGNDLLDLSLKEMVPVLLKRGTGASYARGGTSPKTEIRSLMFIISRFQDKLGREFNDDEKKILHRITSFVSTTIQGRDVGLRFGTPEQAYDMTSGLVNEMLAAHLAIDGKIPMNLVAPEPPKYSPAMEAILEKLRAQACKTYEKILRGEESTIEGKLTQLRFDLYLNEASAKKMAAAAGVGARQPSRKSNDNVSGARAIGCNIAIANTETCFDGSYTIGMFLKELHAEYQAGNVTREDIEMFSHDEFYMKHVMANAFGALARSDYEFVFDKLNNGEGPGWTVGKLQDCLAKNYKSMHENLAFHAVLANDAIHATAYMEALQNGDFDLSHNEIIEKVYNRDDRLNALKFGKRTKQLYPDIQQIQDYAPESRLSRGVVQEMEERIRLHAINPADPRALDPKDKRVVAIMHHIACAGRNLGPFNMNNLQDQPGTAFGSEPLPVLERARVHLYKPGGPLHPAATAEAA